MAENSRVPRVQNEPPGESLAVGFFVAPVCGLALFISAFLLVHFTQYKGYETGLSHGYTFSITILATYGLFAIYFLAIVLGVPTVYLLRRRSALGLASLNAAALAWTALLFVGLRYLVAQPGTPNTLAHELSSVLTALILFAPFVMFSATLFHWIVNQKSVVTFALKDVGILVAIVCGALAVATTVRSVLEPRVVTSIQHPNGSRLLVTQEFNALSEPFTTEVFFDDGNGSWRWYYYDHEDGYWGSAKHEIIGSEIRVSSPGNRAIRIDTVTGQCTTCDAQGHTRSHDKSNRTDAAPPTLTVEGS